MALAACETTDMDSLYAHRWEIHRDLQVNHLIKKIIASYLSNLYYALSL